MCHTVHSSIEDNIHEFSRNVTELLAKLKKALKNVFQVKNREKTLTDCLDELGDILHSHKELSVEFGAFLRMESYLEYFFINEPQKFEDNGDFVRNVFSTFTELLEAKLDYLLKQDVASKKEYDKQYMIYDEKYYDYDRYFHLNIYDNKHEFDKQCGEIGRILIGK